MTSPQWLKWAQKLQAISQNGMAYSTNPFDIERYQAVRNVAVEMLADQTGEDKPNFQDLMDTQAGYATPKVDVRGVVFRDEKILMVRELADGGWTIPGGWADVNESPRQAVEKEVREETGYLVRATKLLSVHDRNMHPHPPYIFHIYKMFFLCDLVGGQPLDSIETSGADFFSQDHLPPLSLARVTPDQMELVFAHHQHPEWPTDFD